MNRFSIGILSAAYFLSTAMSAMATDLPLDWSSPEAFRQSLKLLPKEQQDVLSDAAVIVVIRKFKPDATSIMNDISAVDPDADPYPIAKPELEGKTFEEIQAIANSMQ